METTRFVKLPGRAGAEWRDEQMIGLHRARTRYRLHRHR